MGSPLDDKARVFGAGLGETWWQEHEAAGHSASPVRKQRQLEGCWCPNQTFLFPHKRVHTSVHTWRSENKFVEVALLPGIKLQPSGLVASPSTH